MSGASFWTAKDGEFISNKVEEAINKGDFRDLYWDSIAVDNLKDMEVHIEKIQSNDIFEIDSLEDLAYLKNALKL